MLKENEGILYIEILPQIQQILENLTNFDLQLHFILNVLLLHIIELRHRVLNLQIPLHHWVAVQVLLIHHLPIFSRVLGFLLLLLGLAARENV